MVAHLMTNYRRNQNNKFCNFVKTDIMAIVGIKQKLIGKINQTEDSGILEEMYRLILNEETEGSIYVLSDEQRNAVEEAQ